MTLQPCRVKHSSFRYYQVKVGDIGHLKEVRYQGSRQEAWCLVMERTKEEHWFLRWEVEPCTLP